MKAFKRVVLLACALAAAGMLALAGCSSGTQQQVAATVNGEEIPEQVITDYIENYINANGYTTDEWAQYLGLQDTTAAEFRTNTIDYYVDYLLYKQKASELGITINDDEIDSYISSMKTQMGVDDEGFEKYLSSSGYTDESYRSTVSYSLMVTAVQSKEVAEPTITSKDRQEFADENILNYDSKHVLGIKFSKDDYDKAEKLLKTITSADDPVKAFKANIDKSEDKDLVKKDGELGWSCLVSYGDDWSELVSSDLSEGEVYGYLYQADDDYYILYCDKGYAPAYYGNLKKAIKAMPKALRKVFESDLQRKVYSDATEAYTQTLKDAATIVINDMPSGLSYDVEPVKTDSSSDSSEGSEGSDTSNSADSSTSNTSTK